ncbi:HAMP domain-containing histidine kinase [Lederbergia sp. NSJ-179]|uniref:ATP-binding response regulator n=1 Tax=Lederbergia sp. NSJ-179 TaxID=2931402 RepID=UPI001FD56CBC|nr:HAMP domain-containing sensor histidine kinase [Lederbergia sp. NSJ-179]MCJ7843466.1 HAMP domain-containing histidine kinase [Lederbergia sp. NSJ-179]
MKLQRRIAFHFSIQFVILLVSVFFFFVFLLILVANLMTRAELNANTADGLVDTIPTVVTIEKNQVKLDKKWSRLLKENDMWLQILDKDGHVVYSDQTPSSLKQAYTINDLLLIEETREIDHYPVQTYYDSWMNGKYYFLFGFQHNDKELLGEWFASYSHQGTVDEKDLPALEKQLHSMDGFIQIFKNGELIQSIGSGQDKKISHLELIGRIYEPGKHPTQVKVFNDPASKVSWVLHLPGKESDKPAWLFSSQETQILVVAILISLLVTILFSIWNGYRYGRPLLLFVNWLERMGKERYDEVLTKKDKKKVFKKKGKTRYRYRLYQEVFQSFYSMAEKLSQAEQERIRLEQSREEWMAGISHDLRTPLSTIQGYGHMLESSKYDFSPEELEEIGHVIRKKGDYMLQLVNDFSLVFQLKNSAITLEKQTLEINQYVRKVVLKFEEDLTLSDFSISFIGMDEALYLELDPKWFTRVLDNLIYNAIKHNSPHTKIAVRILKEKDSVNIQVEDNGKGMDETFVANLFDRYYRGTNTNEKLDGLGLGMSIAKAIVELHKGNIEVTSTVGRGTKITIILPIT